MNTHIHLIKRNTKLFFKDKGTFITSLLTPLILLVLYATFLAKVYRDGLVSAMPKGLPIDDSLLDGCVGALMLSSLLAVSCVTVSFCSNLQMVADKVSGAANDLKIAPVKGTTLALGYYISTILSTLIVCFTATAGGMIYLYFVGWYLSFTDVLLIILDVIILVLFGTALSSIINFFLSTQGQMSAVGTIISSGYGFICGAYMPISNLGSGMQSVIAFLPGTYGTSLIRNHTMRGVLAGMEDSGIPNKAVDSIRDTFDCSIYFFGQNVSMPVMYAVMFSSIALLVGIYIFMNIRKQKR
ncbi:MAG: ABC transporter permease [Ruminococcaceae bacterium]|nr:ABC transporter permease [Oscillospiraceae bacterium]